MNSHHLFKLSLCLATFLSLQTAFAQERYERDYPGIPYAEGGGNDAVSRLFAGMENPELVLPHHPVRGYLDAVLAALDINPDSQVLVFSKTSLKQRFITPDNPRALYYNDQVYVGWVPGSSSLEIGAMDPGLGPVFFDLKQAETAMPQAERQLHRCLRCHDSYSFSGGGVPRFMLSTVLAGEAGDIVSHEINLITDTSVPVESRWGGLYVTGEHGQQRHLGNIIVRNAASLREREDNSNGNLSSLEGRVDLTRYLRQTSDIVSLLVLEHQIEVQNRITRAGWEIRNAKNQGVYEESLLAEHAEPLLHSLLMLDEALLEDAVRGSSGFSDWFEARGPRDSAGRSLRELDLGTRTFRYPVSYLVHSDAFRALPPEVLDYVFTEMAAFIEGRRSHPGFGLDPDDRAGLQALLRETLPDFAPYLDSN